MTRKLRLALCSSSIGLVGFGLLWWKAGWVVALAVFLIEWSLLLEREYS